MTVHLFVFHAVEIQLLCQCEERRGDLNAESETVKFNEEPFDYRFPSGRQVRLPDHVQRQTDQQGGNEGPATHGDEVDDHTGWESN